MRISNVTLEHRGLYTVTICDCSAAELTRVTAFCGPKAPPAERDGTEPIGFSEWWAFYPRKVGRRAAERAYAAALKRLPEGVRDRGELLAGLSRANVQWHAEQKETQFIPHPATWLNQDRWKDEPATVAPGNEAVAKAIGLLDGPSSE